MSNTLWEGRSVGGRVAVEKGAGVALAGKRSQGMDVVVVEKHLPLAEKAGVVLEEAIGRAWPCRDHAVGIEYEKVGAALEYQARAIEAEGGHSGRGPEGPVRGRQWSGRRRRQWCA